MVFYSVTKKNEIFSFASKCLELETILSEVSHAQKAKAACSSSYLDYNPKTNAAIYRTPVIIRGGHAWEGQGKRRKLKT
jgi:hypothetical protein